MVVIIVLLALLLILLLWIVFMPVYLKINTSMSQYEITQAGTLSMTFHPFEKPLLTIRVFGFRVPSLTKQKRPLQKPVRQKPRRTFKRSPGSWMFLIKGALRSFRIRQLAGTMDLDDVVLNAQLVPIMLLINGNNVHLSTNFIGQYYLHLETEWRLNKFLWIFLRFLTKK